jgi:hypothetical protein
MQSTVEVGDSYEVGGRRLVVVEVQRSTDGAGVVRFAAAPVTARLWRRADLPLVVSPDPHFACYLLRDQTDPSRYAVGVYHPTLGERLQPAVPRPAPFTEELVLCWAPGPVQVLIDGQPAAQETVSLVLERRTAEGASWCLLPDKYKILQWSEQWQALVDSGERDTAYKTDAAGYVYNAVLGEPVLLPRGHGAWGQRYQDRLYDGAPPPSEYVEHLWLYFRGQRVELREGEPATLNWRSGSVVVSGPPGTKVGLELEDTSVHPPASVRCVVYGEIAAGGSATFSGLYPGRYCLSAWRPGGGTDNRDWTAIARRQWVSVEPGQTASVSVAFETPPPGYWLAYLYTSGAETQAGIEVWGLTFAGYQVVGTTDPQRPRAHRR